MINNKKGILPALILPIIIGVVILIAVMAFMFSGTMRYILIGVGVLLATFIYAIPAVLSSEVTRAKVAIVILLLAVGALFIIVPSVSQTSFGGSFVKPMWGRMECAAEQTVSYSDVLTMTTDMNSASNFVTCGKNELVDKCNVRLDTSNPRWWSTGVRVKYKVCDSSGSNCGPQDTILASEGSVDKLIRDVKSGESLRILCESTTLGINIKCDVKKEYYLFKLYEFYGGGKRLLNAAGCSIMANAENFVEEGEKSQEEYDSCASGSLAKGDWCNFVHDWAYGPATNVFTHDDYGEVYCTGGSIYDIVEITTEGGDVKLVDPTYQTTKEDGETFKGLGSFLDNVECCPSQPKCNDDFEWDTDAETKCYSDAQCQNGGAWFFVSPKTINREACVSKVCTLQTPQTVACARDADCGAGQVCQKRGTPANWKCEMSDGTDPDPDTDPDACAALSAKYPFMGYTYIETSTSSCGWNPLCSWGWMKPSVTTESKCSPTFLIYWIIGGIVVLVGVIVVVLLLPKKKSKGGRRR